MDLALDCLDLDGLFTPDEPAVRDRVRGVVDERIRPHNAGWYATATFRRELVKEMAALGPLGMHPLAVRSAKLVVRTGMDADQRTGQVVEQLAQALLHTTTDKAEGTSAFLEKRPPSFRGE